MRDAIAAESRILELSFPELRELSADNVADHTDEFWEKQLGRILYAAQSALGVDSDSPTDNSKIIKETIQQKSKLAQRILLGSGLSPIEIKKLTPTQAIVLGVIREYRIRNDNVAKWITLPYQQAIKQLEREVLAADDATSLLQLHELLLPAYQQVYSAMARSQRQTALLQTLESIRAYAKENASRLPSNIEELDSPPAPIDPVSGKAFKSSVEEGTLSISGPRLPSGSLDVRVKIKQSHRKLVPD